jgi:hypothetical protein
MTYLMLSWQQYYLSFVRAPKKDNARTESDPPPVPEKKTPFIKERFF